MNVYCIIPCGITYRESIPVLNFGRDILFTLMNHLIEEKRLKQELLEKFGHLCMGLLERIFEILLLPPERYSFKTKDVTKFPTVLAF